MLGTAASSLSRACARLTLGRRQLLTVYAVVATLFAIAHSSIEPYDDAHFFKRIALNGLDHGIFAWNRDEGPVYGATSQTFQAVAVALAALTRTHYALATRVFSIACLVGAFALLLRLTRRSDKGFSATFAFCSAVLLFPTITGMETALAVLSVTLLLWATTRDQIWWGARPSLLLLVYLTRPDAAALGVPLLLERWWKIGRRAWLEAALTIVGLATTLVLFEFTYGTALPLPFYAKQKAFTPYDEHFLRLSAEVGAQRFALFALTATPLLLRALFLRDRMNAVMVAAVTGFVGFHWWSTVDVMGMQGRFYAPSLPLLVCASARAGASRGLRAEPRATLLVAAAIVALFAFLTFTDGLPSRKSFRLDTFPRFVQLATVAGGVALVLSLNRRAWQGALATGVLGIVAVGSLSSVSSSDLVVRNDDEFLALQTSRYTVYRGLDTLRACFGEEIQVYHSEIGLPGLRFQRGKVTDLVGLMSPEWLFRKHGFDELCQRDRPEAIFLPHRNYQGLNAEIQVGSCLQGYRRVVPESSSPLHVRSDLARQYLQCAKERGDEFVIATPALPDIAGAR